MDSVYKVYDPISTPKVDIGKYFQEYHALVSEDSSKQNHDNGDYSIASFMPSLLEEEELEMLAEYCSGGRSQMKERVSEMIYIQKCTMCFMWSNNYLIERSVDKLTVPGEPPKYDKAMIARKGPWCMENTEVPKDTALETLETLDRIYKTQNREHIKTWRKYRGEVNIRYDKVKSDGPTATPGKDSVIYIRVYEPIDNRGPTSRGRKVSLSSMIAVLGTQTLDKVRDLIDCITDLSILTEVSENPQQPSGPVAKDLYKSGFFYIEGTFYNDFRDSDNDDNSRVIREWAESHAVGPFATAVMEHTRVDSLAVRFGYPWVYQHQGSCEHLIVFSDARLLSIDDELAISAYPRIHRLKQRRTRHCMMCAVLPVLWIITDSDRIPHNPCYVCDICLKSYNYIDGKKIGNFKAYRYPHHPDLMKREQEPTEGSSNSEFRPDEEPS